VLPYAEAVSDYLMGLIKTVHMPRKLKVAFSNSPANETHATFRDLGFVARPDGLFDVYAAGGLGGKPRIGVQVAKAVDPSEILYYIEAMVRTFVTHGDYKNRGRSRTRFLQETLGVEGFQAAFNEKLQEVKAEGTDLTISVDLPTITKKGTGEAPANSRIIPQKQDGLYAVKYQPVGGILSPAKAKELYELISDMEDVELRITPEEALYIVNCNAEEAVRVLEATSDSVTTLFEQSVACIGNSICQVGLGDSQTMLQKCVDAVRKENFGYAVLPKVHFSGCPSSCGTHQTAAMGFRGAIKQTPEGPKPAFAIFLGGCALQGKEVIADTGKSIANDDLPNFFIELGKAVTADNMSYEEWAEKHADKLTALIEKYTA
jgi:ferredoxin-nitrite reductase